MNKILKITGNSGFIDLLGVLEYGITIAQYCDAAISIQWSRWENTFDKLFFLNSNIKYIKQHDINNYINNNNNNNNNIFNIHAATKTVTHETPLSFYSELFKTYNVIQIWDNRTIAREKPTSDIFNKISFDPVIFNEIKKYIKTLGESYTAFHGRFTDFPYIDTHIDTFKNNIFQALEQTKDNILLCTDNQTLISEFLTVPRVYNFNYIKELLLNNIKLPDKQGTHLMHNQDIPDFYYNMQKSAITDFLLCVNSKVFHGSNGGYSKFIKTTRASNYINNILKY